MSKPTTAESPAAPPMYQRLHFLDAARAALLLLGIPYHAAQPYSSRAWFIHSETYSRVAELAGELSHQFRMHAFFLVAGFFSALILGKRDKMAWLSDRGQRLLVPFLAMLLLILPIQAVILGAMDGDPLAGLTRMMTEPRLWTVHSWFLRNLFLYCAALALVWGWIGQFRLRIGGWATLGGIVIGFTLWKLAVNLLAGFMLARIQADLVYDFATLLTYLPFFALGVIVCVVPGLLAAVTRYSGWGVAAAVAWLLLSTLLIHRNDFGLGPAAALNASNGLIGSWALIAVARRFLDRPNALVDYFVGAALIFYIVHMAFIFLFTGLLRGTGLPPTIAWLLVTMLTLAGCAVTYELIRRVPLLYFLLNGQARRAPPAPIAEGKPQASVARDSGAALPLTGR